MANPEHVEILKKGVEEWDAWRDDNQILIELIGLSDADLSRTRLGGAILINADLSTIDSADSATSH